MNDNFDPTIKFENAIEQLSLAVQQLESNDLPLDQALKQFEHGVKLGNHCQQILQQAEQQVSQLIEEHQNLQPFSPEKEKEET